MEAATESGAAPGHEPGLMVDGEGFEPPKRVARQIYSLLPLTTRPSVHVEDLPSRNIAFVLEPGRGLEPLTYRLQIGCAANCATRASAEGALTVPTQKRSAAADHQQVSGPSRSSDKGGS